MVVAGATSDHIKVLIPDTFSGPTVNANSPVVLQHVVGLTLGTAHHHMLQNYRRVGIHSGAAKGVRNKDLDVF